MECAESLEALRKLKEVVQGRSFDLAVCHDCMSRCRYKQ